MKISEQNKQTELKNEYMCSETSFSLFSYGQRRQYPFAGGVFSQLPWFAVLGQKEDTLEYLATVKVSEETGKYAFIQILIAKI